MNTSKRFSLCALLLAITPVFVWTEPSHRAYGYDNEADEINFFDFDDDHIPEFDATLFKQPCDLTPCDAVNTFTSSATGIMLQNILAHNLYKRTAPPIVRSLQTDPVLEARRINLCDGQNYFSAKLFFNQMRKVYLSPCSPYIDSFIDFTDTDLIAAIDNALRSFGVNVDIPEVLPLFTQLKLEQRRIGAMLTYQRRNDCLEWRALLPIYYLEHNFFLTQKEQDAIANAPLFKNLAGDTSACTTNDNDSVENLLRQHLVNDAFGLGDLRVQVFYDIADTECVTLALGMELNFPSAITIAKGIIGRVYPSCPNQPTLNLFELMCLAQENVTQATNVGKAFGINTLDRITEVAAQNNLGALHMGIGFLGEFLYHFDDIYTWRNNFRLFYSCPANEPRFFRPTKTDAEFQRDYENCVDSLENLQFLNQQTVLFFYPPVTKARVTPGLVLQYTTAAFFDYCWFKWEIGYDYWHKTKESITIVDYYDAPLALDIEPGIQPAATQQKVFTTLWFDHSDSCRDWRFGIFADATFASKGIGKDWTAGFDIGTRF